MTNRLFKRILLFLLLLAVMYTAMPTVAFATAENKAIGTEGKTISILGDSISTYAGISNNAEANITIGSNQVYYSPGKLEVYLEDTWWQQAIDLLGMRLLVNNSWSGSCILPSRVHTAGVFKTRCIQLHNSHTGEEPDIIAVFMGTNDYSYHQSTLGTSDIDYSALITPNIDGTFQYATPATTCEAYAVMLHKMTLRYPNAEIYCFGMLSRRDPDYDGLDVVPPPTQFNSDLKAIIQQFGCHYVDLETKISANPEGFDQHFGDKKVHPNPAGMDQITEAFVGAILEENVKLRHVSYALTNTTVEKAPTLVLDNEAFETTLQFAENHPDIHIRITMGGKDITASCYENGRIAISRVTGDLQISATALPPAAYYRWEVAGDVLASTGRSDNPPQMLSGEIRNGVIHAAAYKLERPVILHHSRQWTVAFKTTGNWSGMLLSEQSAAGNAGNRYFFKTADVSGLLSFGERSDQYYHNYGIPLADYSIDPAATHIYRLENRIAHDGSNTVWLFVDGRKIGPMNHYFIGGAMDQAQALDWLSGKDFTMGYIGASVHELKRCKLEYLTVWEDHHSHHYENGSCTYCGHPQKTIPNRSSSRTLLISR